MGVVDVIVIGGREVGPNDAATPGPLSVTTCFPLIIAAWALAIRAEFGITDIFGFIATEEEEEGRRPASSVLASVPGGSVIVFVPSGFVTRFSVDMGVEVAKAEEDDKEEEEEDDEEEEEEQQQDQDQDQDQEQDLFPTRVWWTSRRLRVRWEPRANGLGLGARHSC